MKSCRLLPKHPHPKICCKSHLHVGYSPFNGKNLLVLLLESCAPSTRSLRGPQQHEGCWGSSPRGERCRLCQVSRHWHKEHTWSGTACPGLCPQPAQSWSNPCIQPQDVLKDSNIQGPQGSNHCCLHSAASPARGQERIWALQPQELLQSPGKSRAEQSSSSSTEPELPHTGAISWETKHSFAGQKQKLK